MGERSGNDFTKENFEDFGRLLFPLMGSYPPPISKDKLTPWKINMEHNPGVLEDDIPFQMGDL